MRQFVDYRGKKVVITGCFSGMGNAAARQLIELGAEVHGLDFRVPNLDLASFTEMDLRDPAAIEAAADGLRIEKIDGLFNCAGVSADFSRTDVMKINFAGPRLLTEKLLPRFAAGSAISCISSSAGFAWATRLQFLMKFLDVSGYREAVEWSEQNVAAEDDRYTFSKQAIVVWTMLNAVALIDRGIRVNCILPGPTQTPFMEAQAKITPDAFMDVYTRPINRRSSAEEQASMLVFLGSDAASYVNGAAIPVDGGFTAAVTTGALDLRAAFEEVMASMRPA